MNLVPFGNASPFVSAIDRTAVTVFKTTPGIVSKLFPMESSLSFLELSISEISFSKSSMSQYFF